MLLASLPENADLGHQLLIKKELSSLRSVMSSFSVIETRKVTALKYSRGAAQWIKDLQRQSRRGGRVNLQLQIGPCSIKCWSRKWTPSGLDLLIAEAY